jgi:hypothetical protein
VRLIKVSRWLIAVALLMALLAAPATAQETAARFGRDIVVLRLGDNDLLFPYLSPDGGYVGAHVASFADGVAEADSMLSAREVVWQLPDPSGKQVSGLVAPSGEVRVDATLSGPLYAFSRDGEFLALRLDTQLLVYRLPALEPLLALPMPSLTIGEDLSPLQDGWSAMSWASNQSRLAALAGNELVVWQLSTPGIERFPLGGAYWAMTSTDAGWVLESPDGFAVCRFDIGTCDESGFSQYAEDVLPAPDGTLILSQPSCSDGELVTLWRQDRQGRYVIDSLSADIANPRAFSPDSRYLLTRPDCVSQWAVWDVDRLALVQKVERYARPVWLDGGHFAIFDESRLILSLYAVGRDAPVDVLELPSVPGLESAQRWVSPQSPGVAGVSADGTRVLVNLGWAALVVGVMYGG